LNNLVIFVLTKTINKMEVEKFDGYKSASELDEMLKNNKSIARFAVGYYIARGGSKTLEYKIPIFAYELKSDVMYRVLIEYLGMMFWINVQTKDVFYGGNVGLHRSTEGKQLMASLEILKGVEVNMNQIF
jgi:hypothetical protein